MPPSRLLLLFALSAGCTDAQYADPRPDSAAGASDAAALANADGKIVDAAAHDAASQDVRAMEGTKPWHASLHEHYAIATRFYAKDQGLGNAPLFSHEIYSLATITIDGDRVTMEAKRCIDQGNVLAVTLKDDFSWANPQDIAPQTYDLVMRSDGMRTEAPARPLGYRPEQPDGCVDGQQLKVDRPWLPNGMCDCRSDPLPMLPSDCRIVDEDGDGRPGVTVNHKGVFNDPENMRTLDGSQITQGQIADDGSIKAFYVQSYESLPLSCLSPPCNRADLAPCPLEFNPVLFEPLADQEWTCDAMLEQMAKGKLFQLSPLVFVSGC